MLHSDCHRGACTRYGSFLMSTPNIRAISMTWSDAQKGFKCKTASVRLAVCSYRTSMNRPREQDETVSNPFLRSTSGVRADKNHRDAIGQEMHLNAPQLPVYGDTAFGKFSLASGLALRSGNQVLRRKYACVLCASWRWEPRSPLHRVLVRLKGTLPTTKVGTRNETSAIRDLRFLAGSNTGMLCCSRICPRIRWSARLKGIRCKVHRIGRPRTENYVSDP